MTDYSIPRDEQRRLAEDALDILRAEHPLPVSTNALAKRLGLVPFQQNAYLRPQLHRLRREGLVEQVGSGGPTGAAAHSVRTRARFWRVVEADLKDRSW